ncbi:MAG: ATP-binding cassette domain-containing protein [Candidatus Paceibacterota bacterium]|jgi:NitT/TauT family transport system ATP-binding protein
MLEIKDLHVKYKNTGKIALRGISFSVKKGEMVAILGPSGSGKTTLLNIISGLLEKNKEIEVQGSILVSSAGGRSDIKTVFQEPTLLPWRTVAKNISYGLEIKKTPKQVIIEKTNKAMKIVRLEEFKSYYPHQLSIGMKQRVNFARALVCNPGIILLDEPFSALDIKTKKEIQDEFLKIMKANDITSIFVTHDPNEAFLLADKVVVLTKSPGSMKTIIDNPGKRGLLNMKDCAGLYEE